METNGLRKRIIAACLAFVMCAGLTGYSPVVDVLATQPVAAQGGNDAVVSDIPASPEKEESFAVPISGDNAKPEAAIAESESFNTKPEVTIAEPEVDNTKPKVKTAESEIENAKLKVTIAESESDNSEPEVTIAESEIENSESEVTTAESESENAKPKSIVLLQGFDDSVIPFVTGSNDNGAEILIESDSKEKQLSFTIPEEGFSPGSYEINIDTVSGQDFGFSCVVTDNNSNELAWVWCDNYANQYYDYDNDTYYEGSRVSSWDVYFTLSEPGTYTINLSNIYFNNYGDEAENTEATVSAKVYKTIDPPAFAVTEEGFTDAFDLAFTDIPDSTQVYYSIYTRGSQHKFEQEYSLYDPLNPPRINQVCRVMAYAQKETPAGVYKSETIETMYYPDFENAVSNIKHPDNIIASGDTITLTTQDTSLRIYYVLAKDGIDWEYHNTNYILENGTL
ncbi:MAG: hypothetical protein IJQ28_00105, partial [Clostridia bacterium]|nr:hypothetical protein [Clostridia bacterium]